MALWLQISSFVLGAIGTLLGGINILVQLWERRERVNINFMDEAFKSVHIFNPTRNPIEIRDIEIEVDGKHSDPIVDKFGIQDYRPMVLDPKRSIDFKLSSENALDLLRAGQGVVNIRTASGRTHSCKLKPKTSSN